MNRRKNSNLKYDKRKKKNVVKVVKKLTINRRIDKKQSNLVSEAPKDKEKKIYVPLGKEIYRELKTHPIHHIVCTDQPKNAPANQTERERKQIKT